MNALSCTTNQKAVLLAAGTHEERLASGQLLPSELRLLEVLQAAEDYLTRRYPNEHPRFTGMDNTFPGGQQYHFLLEAGQHSFDVLVRFDSHGMMDISDSYFGVIKRAELNALTEDVLASFGLEAKADLKLSGLYGEDYDPNAPLQDILTNGRKIIVHGQVYAANQSGIEALQPQLEQALCRANLCGSFQLCLTDGAAPVQAPEQADTNPSLIVKKYSLSLPEQYTEVKSYGSIC